MAHYADSNEGYKCNGARYYVEHITFNPDFVLSAEAHIQDGLKYIKPTTAYELNEKHFLFLSPNLQLFPWPCWHYPAWLPAAAEKQVSFPTEPYLLFIQFKQFYLSFFRLYS